MKFDLSSILNSAEITKRIAKLSKQAKGIQTEIHEIAVQTLAHIAQHGDYTLATRLLDGLPNGQRVKALANWYRVFSNGAVSFNYDPSNGWQGKLAKKRTLEMFDLDGAVDTTFADLVPEKGYQTLTLAGLVAMFKRKADEDGKNPDGSDKVAPGVRDICAELYGKYRDQLKPVAVESEEPEGQTA